MDCIVISQHSKNIRFIVRTLTSVNANSQIVILSEMEIKRTAELCNAKRRSTREQ